MWTSPESFILASYQDHTGLGPLSPETCPVNIVVFIVEVECKTNDECVIYFSLGFNLSGHSQSDVTWKLTGNIGGEDYLDIARGPLNEGGLYAERQGWHQPSPPSQNWDDSSPLAGITEPGVGFWTNSFSLSLPKGYDVPLYFVFGNNRDSTQSYRVQLYVNGYQYGKFVPHTRPQTEFPVPQGILNYQGENSVTVTLWAHGSKDAKLNSFELVNRTPVLTALNGVTSSEQPAY
ncbi:galactose-binding domain-like protein [Talaromyces proteolyticus]|uniref:Galactose-binding domain-like protein n=1 Tax=Talaromyces proteolyticus TaxID=1131652 RepID=A0AAD4PWY6_9EURO|nr:galactose-binding domain-like protein [Talaromyces proteolyticus]KAH8698712.1 galactose-binding domain-like protein [Talaromyces proteolyticus]